MADLDPAMLIAGYARLILLFFSALSFIGAWSAAQIWFSERRAT